MSPTVGDDFLISRQNDSEFFEFVHWGAERARDVSTGERISAAGIEEDEIEFPILDGV